jgi:hypothetical protein
MALRMSMAVSAGSQHQKSRPARHRVADLRLRRGGQEGGLAHAAHPMAAHGRPAALAIPGDPALYRAIVDAQRRCHGAQGLPRPEQPERVQPRSERAVALGEISCPQRLLSVVIVPCPHEWSPAHRSPPRSSGRQFTAALERNGRRHDGATSSYSSFAVDNRIAIH